MTQQNKPQTEVIIKHKETQSVSEFANMLEAIAKKLKEEGQFTFVQGDEHVVIQPSNQVSVEYEYEIKGDKHSFEIELDWYTGQRAQKSMGIK